MTRGLVHRYLDPEESLGELLFGLIMALTVTLGVSLLPPSEEILPRQLVIALIGCNIAWGIIDAGLYLLGSLFARNQRVHFVRKLAGIGDRAQALKAIRDEFGLEDEEQAREQDVTAFYAAALDVLRHVRAERAHLRGRDLCAAAIIVALVSLTAVPGALPFLLVDDRMLALRLANVLQVGLLFVVGFHWARYSGASPWRTGLAIVGLGIAFVVVSIALGG